MSQKIKSKDKFIFLFALSFMLSVAPTAQAVTFSPTAIDISAAEIPNPMRGSYTWYFNAKQPSNWPILDGYVRYSWGSVETSQGVYNFSQIDKDIASIAAQGGRFGFRIMAANTSGGGKSVPDYLISLMPLGFTTAVNSTYVPDWNDPDFMSRAQALLNALGARYNNDPRVGWIDIGFYGNWAEWHLFDLSYPSPTGAVAMTSANKHLIVDYHIAAFPNKQIISMKDDADAFNYALGKSPNIGWRNDCFGDPWFSDGMNNLFSSYPYAADRWKTAPILSEFCGGQSDMTLALNQVKMFHVSLVSMGNLPTQSGSSLTTLQTVNKTAGYRLIPRNLTIPSLLQSNQSFSVSSVWSNVNVAPFTMPWKLWIQLRNPSTGAVAWQGQSSLVFQNLLPTTNLNTGVDTPITINDSFSLNNVPAATYDLVVIIPDPENYYKPLALAIQGRQLDGSYKLGQVTVQGSTPSPSPSSGPAGCDLNKDNQVNILDLQFLANVILGITSNPGNADLNKDSQVNILDLQYLANVILGKSSCP